MSRSDVHDPDLDGSGTPTVAVRVSAPAKKSIAAAHDTLASDPFEETVCSGADGLSTNSAMVDPLSVRLTFNDLST